MKINKKRLLNIAFLIFTFGVIVVIGLIDQNKIDVAEAISQLNLGYLMGALICMLIFWGMDSHMIQFCTNNTNSHKISFMTGLRIALIGQMYSALTPSAVGGQPMQVYYLTHHRVPGGAGTSVVVIKFIAYQAVACGLFLFAVCYKFAFFMETFGGAMALMIFGFLISFAALFVAVMSMVRPDSVTKIAHKLLNFLHRIKLVKNLEKRRASWEKTLGEYHDSMTYIKKFKGRIVWVFIAHLIHLSAFFAVTYFIYLACGLNSMDVIDIVCLQAILWLAVSYVPLPGASIASEGGFMLVFGHVFGVWAFTAMALWRIITYYGNIVAGAIALVFENVLSRKRKQVKPASPSAK